MWRESLVFCVLLAVALGAKAIAPLEPKPEKFKDVEGCYITELDEVIPLGNRVPSKTQCKAYLCNDDSVSIHTCGLVRVNPPCKVVQDLDKPYPDCCPKPQCPDKSDVE